MSGDVAWPVLDLGKGDVDRRWLWEKGEVVRQGWGKACLEVWVVSRPPLVLKTRLRRGNFLCRGTSVWSTVVENQATLFGTRVVREKNCR